MPLRAPFRSSTIWGVERFGCVSCVVALAVAACGGRTDVERDEVSNPAPAVPRPPICGPEPRALGPVPSGGFALGPDDVVWRQQTSDPPDYSSLRRLSLVTREIVELGTRGQADAADAENVYWSTLQGELWAQPLAGGEPRVLFEEPNGLGWSRLVVAAPYLYFALGGVVRRLRHGGSPQVVADGRTRFSDGRVLGHVLLAGVDNGQLYWRRSECEEFATGGYGCPAPGVLMRTALDTFATETLANPFTDCADVEVGGGYLAYCEAKGFDEALWSWNLATGERRQLVAPREHRYGVNIAIDGNYLYFTEGSTDGSLVRVRLAGGEREVLAPTVATGWCPIRVDADCIYWVASTGLMTMAK